jgi:SPP1 gp7 family putative phage head morphogenesis protein
MIREGINTRVTEKERSRARTYDRDLGRIVRRGTASAARIGFLAQGAVMHAYRRRKGDPLGVLSRQIRKAVPLLRDAMVVAHFQGIVRTGRTSPELAKELALSSAIYVEAMRVLKNRFKTPVAQIDRIKEQYEAEAVRVVDGTLARVEKRVQQAIVTAQTKGMHVADGVKEVGKAFKASGLTPQNSFTLEAIFRTQTHMAYSAGRWHANQHPAVNEILWGYKYITVGDDRVRLEHEALDGVTLSKNDPQWNVIYPPNGWACRCQAVELFEEEEVVRPAAMVEIEGKTVIPGADAGFKFHPGKLFGQMEPPVLRSR